MNISMRKMHHSFLMKFPHVFFADRPHKLDIAHADIHSFIAEECVTTKKYLVRGKYGYLMKHDVLQMFPKARSMLENSYYNFRVTPKTLPGEKDIYRVGE